VGKACFKLDQEEQVISKVINEESGSNDFDSVIGYRIFFSMAQKLLASHGFPIIEVSTTSPRITTLGRTPLGE